MNSIKVAFATVKSLDETTRQRREKREELYLLTWSFDTTWNLKKLGYSIILTDQFPKEEQCSSKRMIIS